MTARLRTHAFAWDPELDADHRGHRYCICGLVEDNKVHDLPPAPPEQTAHRQRVGDIE